MTGPWTADLWFDPSCPYNWVTANWLREVATVRPVTIGWHVMSLSVLNEHRDDDPEGDPDGYLWVPVRICAAVAERHGHEALGRLHAALWGHARTEHDWLGDLETALADAGLPRDLAAVGMTTEYDDAVRAAHAEAVTMLDGHAGTPVLALTGPDGVHRALTGPVLSEVPRGAAAGRLWDGLVLMTGVTGFHAVTGRPLAPPSPT